jgi:hypothetical protein
MKKQTIKFCKNKCCPIVEIYEDVVILGDKEGPEGITTWNKAQFKDFIDAAKSGKFDEAIKEQN